VLASVLAVALTTANGVQAVEQPLWSDELVITGCVNVSPVQLTPNSGWFTGPVSCAPPFHVLPSVCEIVSDNNIPPAVEAPYDCSGGFTFNGTYSNIMCGTGTAAGQATIPESDSSYNVSFLIMFIANQAIFLGNAATDDGFDVFTGPVTIVPTAPLVPPCPVTQFRFATVLTAVDSPVPLPIG
jgi:hypothetical protein